ICLFILLSRFFFVYFFFYFFSSRRRHTRSKRDWSSDVCSSDLPSSRCASERPSGESSRIAVMGIIKAMPSTTMTTIHMARILRSVRPPRHLIAQRVEQTGAVADQERCEREHALLRLAARIHRRPGAGDLAHQRLAL